MVAVASLLISVSLVACAAGDPGPRDAAAFDASALDAQPADAGTADADAEAGAPDADVFDANIADANVFDADVSDAGSMCAPDCVPPPNASAACPSGTCDFVCDTGWVRRGDACIAELACAPGLVGSPVRVTTDGNRNNTPAIAVSGTVAAVFWTQGAVGNATRAVYARFYDYPTFAPRTDAQVVASGSLDATGRIEVVPVSTGFAVLYDRVAGTTGTARCSLYLYDRDGVRTPGSSDATGGVTCRQHAFAGSDSGFAMAWRDAQVDARRFDPSGLRVVGAATTLITAVGGTGGGNHITWHPDRADYRIAYTVFAAGTATLMTATLSPAGFRTTVDVPAVAGFDSTSSPEIVAADLGYGLLFSGRMAAGDPQERYLVALDGDGGALAAPRSLGASTRAALAAGPHELGVVLGTGGNVQVRVHDLAGAPVGTPIPVASGPSDADWPDIAWAGDGFVVAWSDDVGGAGLDDVYVARVCPAR